jgi:uncharacterized protein YndB with AHSA1/START domain
VSISLTRRQRGDKLTDGERTTAATCDYTKQAHIGASPERVFEILTTAAEFASWWASAIGSAAEAGQLWVIFDGIDDPLTSGEA